MPKLRIPAFGSMIFWALVLVLTVLVVSLSALWIDLQWSISIQVYSLKASLDWFQIVFYHNYAFVVGALFSLLLVNPRIGHSDLWRLISAIRKGVSFEPRLEEPKDSILTPVSAKLPRGKLLWFPWQLAKWAVGFVVFVVGRGNIFFLGNAINPIMMTSMGIGSLSDAARIFILPISMASATDLVSLMPSMEAEYRIIQLAALAFLTILAIRIVLRLVASFRTNTVAQWLRGFFSVMAIVVFSVILGAPYWLMDVRTPFIYGATWTLFLFFIFAWAYLKVFGLKVIEKRSSRTILFRGIAILIVAAMVIQVGFVAFFSLNWNNNYLVYEWYPQTEKEITVTRWAAGLNGIKLGSVLSLPTSNASTILGLVRQWDQEAASVTMTKEIGAYNWMGLASSQIVFLNNSEYWVSPTTPTFPSADWISEHIIYTHAARIMVINTHTGAEVSTEQAFSVGSEPLIYYGESPDAGPGGFGNNVYVSVPGYSEVENVTYGGEPDYTLNGWQKAMWFIFSESQLGFAFSSYPIDMLWNRNIFNRVGEILIPGLVMDPSAYLATDGKDVFYVIQIYVDYPLQSGFANSPYLRFFGVVLANVYDGSMHGYTVSNIIGSNSSDFLTDYYSRYYSSWQQAPSWLVPQLRYPEQLLGTPDVKGQLDYDFLFHVSDPFVWRSGSQFYERPSNNTVQYIPWAIGENTYFVGMQLAHFQSASSKNLAGLYIAYGGDKLGQIDLYQNPSLSTTFIGPSAAENALTTNSEVRTQLTLLPNYRIGSYLLYSVAGSLDYFVAVYTNPGTAGVVTQLPFMTAIDPTTGNVGVGASATDAYYNLIGEGQPVQPGNNTQVLMENIFSLASSLNYLVVNATSVNPNVWIQADNVSLGTAGMNTTLERVASFMHTYGPQSIANTLYMWSESLGDLNLGAMQVLDSKIIEMYYITVTA
jgi:hypothetical protein